VIHHKSGQFNFSLQVKINRIEYGGNSSKKRPMYKNVQDFLSENWLKFFYNQYKKKLTLNDFLQKFVTIGPTE